MHVISVMSIMPAIREVYVMPRLDGSPGMSEMPE